MKHQLSTDRLWRHMEMQEVTASQLASMVGISRQAVYNLMNGKSQPHPQTLKHIAEALHCRTDELCGSDLKSAEHERFAALLVARHDYERDDYNVKSAVMEYVRDWLMEHYDDLDRKTYKEAREQADNCGTDLARRIDEMLSVFDHNGVRADTATAAILECLNLEFDVIESMVDTVLPINDEFRAFDLEDLAE